MKRQWRPGRMKIQRLCMIAVIVVISAVFYYWLNRPSFIQDDLINQIKPGMLVETAKSLLGKPCDVNEYILWGPALTSLDYRGPILGNRWESQRIGLIADTPVGAHPEVGMFQSHYWISNQRMLLWVESHGGVIVHTWVVPLRKAS